MNRLLKEPLVHFLALGGLLFAGWAVLNRSAAPAPGRIVVSQGQLASMMETFARTRQRPPTPDEWDGLIRARVREEVYYREALALGLDKDDAIIRRRLQQKMEFVSDDTAAQASPPTDAELNAYLEAHPDTFRLEERFTFRQVYLDPAKHGESLARDAARLLERLNRAGGDTGFAAMGDPFVLDTTLTALPAGEIAGKFGERFAAALGGLPLGRWQGPVESAYGVHLVLVSERAAGRVPALAEVRDAVRREWDDARRRDANETFYRELLKHYTVTIEQPAAGEQGKKLAEAN
jgi:hypothetical protein